MSEMVRWYIWICTGTTVGVLLLHSLLLLIRGDGRTKTIIHRHEISLRVHSDNWEDIIELIKEKRQ